jgi:hypothetical protein
MPLISAHPNGEHGIADGVWHSKPTAGNQRALHLKDVEGPAGFPCRPSPSRFALAHAPTAVLVFSTLLHR